MSRLTKYEIEGVNIEELGYMPCKDYCKTHECSDCAIQRVMDKLAHYEDLEEQGRLIVTKYVKGQTIYEVDDETGEICEYEVTSDDVWHDVTSDNYDPWNALTCFREDSPLIFTTKEEAEAKLAELGGKA